MAIVRGDAEQGVDTQTPARDSLDEQDYHLDLTLYPQRSLKPEHFSRLLLVLIFICTLASVRFWIVGAWPVVLFLGLDIVALWFAFFLSYRRGRIFETIQLSDKDLIVSKGDPSGKLTTDRFEPYWTKVAIETVGADKNILTISNHGQSIELGAFLVPHERKEVAVAIRSAIDRWKNR